MRKFFIAILALFLLSSCSITKSEPLMKKFELAASDFGSEYTVPEENESSILTIFNINEELSCYYEKNYNNASTPSVMSNSLTSPTVQLFKSRVDQFKSSSIARKYFDILSTKKGMKCFEDNYSEKLSTSLSQSGAELKDVTAIKEIKRGNNFMYRTVTVTVKSASNSALYQDYKVAFYYNLIGNKVFTSVLAYNEEKKVDQIASSLPKALENSII